MRIAISTLIARPGGANSHESYLLNLLRAMAGNSPEHDFILFVSPHNRELFSGFPGNWRLCALPKISSQGAASRIIWEQMVLPFLAAQKQADILHFPGTIGALWSPVKTVVTVHWDLDPMHKKSLSLTKQWYFRLFFKASALRAGRLLVPSAAFAEELAQRWGLPRERLAVVPHGVSGAFEKASLGEFPDRPDLPSHFILSVTNSLPHKNLPQQIRAFALLKKQIQSEVKLVLVGRISPSGLSQLLTEQGIPGDAVILLGPLSHEELPAIYRQARLYLTLSTTESAGMTLVEAMSSGLPVVASDIPAHREAGGKAPVFVSVQNEEQTAQAMRQLLDDPKEHRRRAEAGRLRSQAYSWEMAARKTLQAYQEAVAERERK
ncbi:MAG: glycosyltransferase family 1 protein [Deltaproteobacteria bacterium]|nr:MAG: glycosyltransferase family 1 protein [Deltaproteobacteria bacterium]